MSDMNNAQNVKTEETIDVQSSEQNLENEQSMEQPNVVEEVISEETSISEEPASEETSLTEQPASEETSETEQSTSEETSLTEQPTSEEGSETEQQESNQESEVQPGSTDSMNIEQNGNKEMEHYNTIIKDAMKLKHKFTKKHQKWNDVEKQEWRTKLSNSFIKLLQVSKHKNTYKVHHVQINKLRNKFNHYLNKMNGITKKQKNGKSKKSKNMKI